MVEERNSSFSTFQIRCFSKFCPIMPGGTAPNAGGRSYLKHAHPTATGSGASGPPKDPPFPAGSSVAASLPSGSHSSATTTPSTAPLCDVLHTATPGSENPSIMAVSERVTTVADHDDDDADSRQQVNRGLPNAASTGSTQLPEANLPSFLIPVAALWHWFLPSLIHSTDSYAQVIRKVCVALLLIGACTSLGGLTDFLEFSRNRRNLAAFVSAVSRFCFLCLVCFPAYVTLRVLRHVNDALCVYLATGVCVTLGVVSICSVSQATEMTFAGLAMGSIVMDLPGLIPFNAACMFVVVLRVVNQATVNLLMIPGDASAGSLLPRLQGKIVTVVVFALMMKLFHSLRNEFHKKLDQSAAASTLAAVVAAKLAQYDTDAVDELLQQYADSAHVDLALLGPLKDINANLKKYRPHLPNYVLPGRDDNDDTEGDLVTEEDARSADGAGGGLPARSAGFIPQSARSSQRGFLTHRDGTVAAEAPPSSLDQLSSSDVFIGKVSFCILKFDFDRSFDARTTTALVLQLRESSQASAASLHSFVGDVLCASWNATKRVAKCESRACRFALAVHQLCDQRTNSTTRFARRKSGASSQSHAPAAPVEPASNHHVMPPHLTLTPPLTGSPQPLTAATAAAGSSCPFSVTGSIVTTVGRCAFAGDDRMRLFLLNLSGVHDRQHELGHLAVHCGNVICVDAHTKEHAEFDFVFRGVDVLSQAAVTRISEAVPRMPALCAPNFGQPSASTSLRLEHGTGSQSPRQGATWRPSHNTLERIAYELVSDRAVASAGNSDLEWMYDLERQADDKNIFVTRAAMLYAEDRHSEALLEIQRLSSSTPGSGVGMTAASDVEVGSSVSAKRLHDLIEASILRGPVRKQQGTSPAGILGATLSPGSISLNSQSVRSVVPP